MKKLLLFILGIIISGCSNLIDNSPKCDDEDVKATVLHLLYDDIIQNWNEKYNKDPQKFAVAKEIADNLLNTNLTTIITTDVNKELNSCECQATVELSDEVMDVLAAEVNKMGDVSLIQLASLNDLGNQLKADQIIYYDLKTDSEGEVIVELYQD